MRRTAAAARKMPLMKTEKTVLVNEEKTTLLLSAVLATIISAALSTGFTLMLGTTFSIAFSIRRIVFASALTAIIYSAVFLINKKWISFAALMSAPAAFALSLYKDWFNARNGLMGLLYYIKLYVFLWLPGEYPEDPEADKTVLAFLILYNLIAISVTAFVVMKRKWISCALIFYMPLFLFSVTNTDISPKAAPCLVAGAGTIMLLLCNAFRKKKRSTYERMLLALTVPVFVFMFILGGIFPQEKYNKDKLARNLIIETRDWLDRKAGRDNPLRGLLERALNGFENTDFDDSFDAVSPLYASPTNLNKVGPFNPTTEEILKVKRYANPDFKGRTPYFSSTLYLKTESLDTYRNNTLTSSKIKSDPYKKNEEQEAVTAPYGIRITPVKSTSIDIVPYYTDHYNLNGGEAVRLNPYTSTHKRISDFASSNVPVKTGNIYSDYYLKNYVYKTCLEVPYSTDRALILGGNLPEWYLDVYNGRTQMSDYLKVKNVTEYVRGLHPYSVDTPYPPAGADFVAWFVNEGESGICVHYAVTSVVLLRMIGVPARYVRGYVAPDSMLDNETTVIASYSHAWFEVFVSDYGWVMGDATPGYNVDASYFDIGALSRTDSEVEKQDFAHDRESETETTAETSVTTETTAGTTSAASETTDGGAGAQTAPSDNQSVPSPGRTGGTDQDYTGHYPVSDLPGQQDHVPEFLINTLKLFLYLFIAVTAIVLAALVFRAYFVIYWTNRFSSGKINDRTVARYHYYMLMSRIFRFIYPEMVRELAEKAVFSGAEISQKEYESLVRTCRQIMNTSSVDYSGIKKMMFRLMLLPEMKET